LEWIVGRPNAEAVKNAIATLEAAREAGDPSEIAYGLANLASAIRDGGDLKRADALFAEAFREPGALSTVASNHVLRNWAITNLQADDVEIARQRFTEVARSERPGSEMHASALLNLGELEFAVGNFEAAQAAARRAKEIFEEINAAPLALVFCNLAAYAIALDQLDEARRLLRDAIALLTRSSARWIVDAIEHHALLAALLGDHERAAALMGFSDAQRAAAGSTRQRTERHGYERLQALLATACDERELAANVAAGSRLTVEQAIEHASAITQEVKPAATESGA
jgi:tetratricopeptide (TPR) repeat protein